MWGRFFIVREIHRLERAIAGKTGAREALENRLDTERLKLLGPNAATVDPARLFHGSDRKPT
jgi:hypothetical protein